MKMQSIPYGHAITDHNQLVMIINHHRLDEIENPRLQRLCAKIMAFNFKATWQKGSTNYAPDAGAHALPEIQVGTNVAVQDSRTRL